MILDTGRLKYQYQGLSIYNQKKHVLFFEML